MTDKGLHSKLIEQSLESVQIEMTFSQDYPYFEGHFEKFPILPALIQVHLVVQASKRYFKEIKNPSVINTLKFIKPITPSMRILLKIDYDQLKKQIRFSYRLGDALLSQGAMKI